MAVNISLISCLTTSSETPVTDYGPNVINARARARDVVINRGTHGLQIKSRGEGAENKKDSDGETGTSLPLKYSKL